jgi:hypothetical protein
MSNTAQVNTAQQELDTAINLSTGIFKEGTLINVTIGFWAGKISQSEKDQEVLTSNIDYEIYAPGFKWLIPQKYIRPFIQYRSRLKSVMDRMSYSVPGMRGSKFVPKRAYADIRQFLNQQKAEFFQEMHAFIEKYPIIVAEQITKFNERYPEHVGTMDTLYPDVRTLEQKFTYTWTPYSWAHTEIAEIAADAKAQLAERSMQLVHQSSVQIRKHIINATESVVRAIQNGKNKVNIRAVSVFTTRIDELKQLNLFNDPEIDKILKGATDSLTCISSWEKESIDETDLESKLTGMVRSLTNEVSRLEADPDQYLVSTRTINLQSLTEEDTETPHDPEVAVRDVLYAVEAIRNINGEA